MKFVENNFGYSFCFASVKFESYEVPFSGRGHVDSEFKEKFKSLCTVDQCAVSWGKIIEFQICLFIIGGILSILTYPWTSKCVAFNRIFSNSCRRQDLNHAYIKWTIVILDHKTENDVNVDDDDDDDDVDDVFIVRKFNNSTVAFATVSFYTPSLSIVHCCVY